MTRDTDHEWCPARIAPHPAGVPRDRQLRAILTDAGAVLTVMWLDAGGGVCVVRLPAAMFDVRQIGCRCTANPRLVAMETEQPRS